MSELLNTLRNAPDNTVIYSHKAWASARKGAGNSDWFPDRGAHRDTSLTANQLVDWTDDWIVVHTPKLEVRLPERVGSVITWGHEYHVAQRTGVSGWLLTRPQKNKTYLNDEDILAFIGEEDVFLATFTKIEPS